MGDHGQAPSLARMFPATSKIGRAQPMEAERELLQSDIAGTPQLTLNLGNGQSLPLTQGNKIAVRSPMNGQSAVNLANVLRQDVTSQPTELLRQPRGRWKPPGVNGQPWSVMVAPRLWATLEQIGFLPREQLTWTKALNPEDVATSTAWGSWCSASNPVLRAVAEPVFIASKLTHRRSP